MCVVGVTFSVLERAICHGSQEEIAEDIEFIFPVP